MSLEAALISRRRPPAPGPHRVPAGSRVSSHSTGQRQREPRPGGKSPASSRPRAHCAFGGWVPIQGTADASGHAREAVSAGQSLTTWGQDSAPRLHTAQGCASAAASLGSGGGLSPPPPRHLALTGGLALGSPLSQARPGSLSLFLNNRAQELTHPRMGVPGNRSIKKAFSASLVTFTNPSDMEGV